jgi:hypothetical protein
MLRLMCILTALAKIWINFPKTHIQTFPRYSSLQGGTGEVGRARQYGYAANDGSRWAISFR